METTPTPAPAPATAPAAAKTDSCSAKFILPAAFSSIGMVGFALWAVQKDYSGWGIFGMILLGMVLGTAVGRLLSLLFGKKKAVPPAAPAPEPAPAA